MEGRFHDEVVRWFTSASRGFAAAAAAARQGLFAGEPQEKG